MTKQGQRHLVTRNNRGKGSNKTAAVSDGLGVDSSTTESNKTPNPSATSQREDEDAVTNRGLDGKTTRRTTRKRKGNKLKKKVAEVDDDAMNEYEFNEKDEEPTKSHLKKTNLPLETGDLKCDVCKRTFSNVSGFKRHQKACQEAYGPPVVVKIKKIPIQDADDIDDVDYQDMLDDVDVPDSIDGAINDAVGGHAKGAPGKCHCCGEDLETAHEGGDFQCDVCLKTFKLKSSLERHKKVIHEEGDTHSCPECGARCPDKGTLARHMYTHTGLKPYTCDRCNRQFSRKYHLERHVVQTGCDGTPKPAHPCQVCGKMFSRKDNLREHLRAHAGQVKRKKKFACEFCNKEFHGTSLLQVHLRTHTGERPFVCEFCHKGFPSSGAVKKHRRMHTGERPYECKQCLAKFAAKETLNRHIKTHTGVKPHVCQYCGKSFIQPSQLRAHIFHHTGENGFTCDHCGKAFNRRARLVMHVRYVHEGAKPFQCERCQKPFVRKEDLARHSVLHTGLKAHKCPICEKSFAIKSSLKIHLLTHTKEPPCACDECGRAFIRQDCLLRHMRTHHRDMLEEVMAEAEKKKLQQQLLAATVSHTDPEVRSLNEAALADSIKELLTLLVDESTLQAFGWPDTPVEKLLELVIRRCGHQPVGNESNYGSLNSLRENAKLLFTVVIDDSAVKTLLNNQTVDEVIQHVLRLAKS